MFPIFYICIYLLNAISHKCLVAYNINMSMNLIQFDKKCKCGPEFVCVRIIENCDNLKVGSIYLPQNSEVNTRLAFAQIEDVGWKAAEEYGLKNGDYVLFDRLSTFAHTYPVALTRYNNIIVKTDKDRSDYFPLRNMAFVEPDKKEAVTNLNGIFVPNYSGKLMLGTIVKANFDEELKVPFKPNDRVLLAKGADIVQLGTTTLHIYKHDMLVCTVED